MKKLLKKRNPTNLIILDLKTLRKNLIRIANLVDSEEVLDLIDQSMMITGNIEDNLKS